MASEELEIVTVVSSSDYWGTYPNFYINQDEAIEISDALVMISDQELDSRHEITSERVSGFSWAIGVPSASHDVESPELKLLSERLVWPANVSHDVESDSTPVKISVTPSDTAHDVLSKESEISSGLVVPGVADASHDTTADTFAVTARILLGAPDSACHEIFGSGWADIGLIHRIRVAPCAHDHSCDEWLLVGASGKYISPRDCWLAVEDSGVGPLSGREVIHIINNGLHYITSERVGPMPAVYIAHPDDCTHDVESDKVSPEFIRPSSAYNAVTSSYIGGWPSNSSHDVSSDVVRCVPTINPTPCSHGFKPQAHVLLGLAVVADDCSHGVVTKDTASVASCSHSVNSDLLRPNRWYRRINV